MIVYTVTVKASAAKDQVVPTGDETFDVFTTAPILKGKANKEMVKLLAAHLGIPQSRLMLVKGEKFHIKTVIVMDEK